MEKRTNKNELITERKLIRDKIEVLKIDYSFISYSNESANLKAVKDEINEFCQKHMPSETISKGVISHLMGALVYSKHPDKVGEIFKGIEDVIDLNTEKEIDNSKVKKERKPDNYAIIILGICIIVSTLIFAYSFRYERTNIEWYGRSTDKGLIIFDRWTGEFIQKRL